MGNKKARSGLFELNKYSGYDQLYPEYTHARWTTWGISSYAIWLYKIEDGEIVKEKRFKIVNRQLFNGMVKDIRQIIVDSSQADLDLMAITIKIGG